MTTTEQMDLLNHWIGPLLILPPQTSPKLIAFSLYNSEDPHSLPDFHNAPGGIGLINFAGVIMFSSNYSVLMRGAYV